MLFVFPFSSSFCIYDGKIFFLRAEEKMEKIYIIFLSPLVGFSSCSSEWDFLLKISTWFMVGKYEECWVAELTARTQFVCGRRKKIEMLRKTSTKSN